MAYENQILDVTRKAGAAVTKFRIVKLDANGDVIHATAQAEAYYGIAQNTVTAAGQSVRVRKLGISKLEASAAIALAAKIASAAAGKGATATALDGTWGGTAVEVIAEAEEAAAADGDIISVFVSRNYYGT